MDSYTETDSCDDTCDWDACECSDCQVDCLVEPDQYCVVGICGAECVTDDDCDDNNSNTIDSCLENCECYHEDIGECVVPYDGMDISEDTIFCEGSYNISNGINIEADGITLDCNNAEIIGSQGSQGIRIFNKQNVTITNCKITNYHTGIYLKVSRYNKFIHNYIVQIRKI